MERKFLSISLAIALISVLIGTFGNPYAVIADSGDTPRPTPTPVIERGGPPIVHQEPVSSIDSQQSSAIYATSYRRAWTDAWRVVWASPYKVDHVGSHNSESDLVEEKIWTDGSLRVGNLGIVASCSNHNAGQFAHCETIKSYYLAFKIVATTYSFFHKTGYIDQNFTTSYTLN